MQQQLAVAARLVTAPRGSPEIGRDVHPLDIQLTVGKIAIRVAERSLPRPERLDLRPDKHNASLIGLKEFVIERSPFVVNLYLSICLFLCHIRLSPSIP